MEPDNDPGRSQQSVEGDEAAAEENGGCAGLIIKLILGAFVFFLVAFGLVFGVCLLG